MNTNEKRIKMQKLWSIPLMVMLGSVIGFVLAVWSILKLPAEYSTMQLYLRVIALLVFYGAYTVQLVLHEAGHLLFGLLVGYRFASFRVFSLTLVKEEEKLRFKRYRVAGTAGQCLMRSPAKSVGKGGVILYNLGGVLLNLSTIPHFFLLFILAVILRIPFFLATFPLALALAGGLIAMINGVPMRLQMVNNDGYNVWEATRNQDTLRAFDLQLKITERLLEGQRLKDMPNEWFVLPEDTAMKNSMRATEGVLIANRLVDEHRFEEAEKLMAHLLEMESGIVGLHRSLLFFDRLFVELIGEARQEVISSLYTKELQKSALMLKSTLTVSRTLYAYALIVKKDPAEAKKWKALFEKTAATYPYKNEVTAERELLALAEKRAQEE